MIEKKTHVGSGVTSFKKSMLTPETPDEMANAMASWAERMNTPFDSFCPWVKAAARELAGYRAEVGPRYKFRPHDEPGWYCEEILFRDRHAREHATKGNVQWAMFHAAHLGKLIAEAELKFKLESIVQRVEMANDTRASAAIRGRMMSKSARVSIMAAIKQRSPRLSIKAAAQAAAAQNPGCGKWKAFERDWYQREKLP